LPSNFGETGACHHHLTITPSEGDGSLQRRGRRAKAADARNPETTGVLESLRKRPDRSVEEEASWRENRTSSGNCSSLFNLGNMLRADGRKVEAEAAFRAATRADPMIAEAWYDLSTR